MSYWNVFMLCVACSIIATVIAGHAFRPELHFSWWNVIGWIFFIFSILAWEFGKK